MTPDCKKAEGYWKLSYSYLWAAELFVKGIIKNDNRRSTGSTQDITSEFIRREFAWSDFRIVEPLLFNFYHGLELLMKGFLVSQGKLNKKSHKLSELLDDFKKCFPKGKDLSKKLSNYIIANQLPKLLADFCKESSITIDDYYQALRYPESTNGIIFNHQVLKYKGTEGTIFYKELILNIQIIRVISVCLAERICPRE